ncbi:MAG: sporulation protein [Bacillales bacterium]|jgi:sporulation integral membrane protein YtvI|nr:sporulation protein [Bacillales bacterium]
MKLSIKNIILAIIAIVILFYILPKAVPLVLAFVTAIFMEPIVKFFQHKQNLRRVYAVPITFFIFLITFTGFSYFVVTKLYKQVIMVFNSLPTYVSMFNYKIFDKYINELKDFSHSLPTQWINSVENAINSINENIISLATNLISTLSQGLTSIPSFLLEYLFYLIAVYLFSLELPRISEGFMNLFAEHTKDKMALVLDKLKVAFIGFIKAQFFLSALTFSIAYLGLTLIGIKAKLFITLVIVVVDILPILGTGSILVPWAIYNFVIGDSTTGTSLIILFIFITVVRRLIEPKVFSQSMGITPLAALVSLYLGFKLLGFTGVILGPAFVIVFDTMRKVGLIKFKHLF